MGQNEKLDLELVEGARRGVGDNCSVMVDAGCCWDTATAIKRAQQLEPLSLPMNWAAGEIFYYARQYDQAVRELRNALELQPDFVPMHVMLARLYHYKGMSTEAMAEIEKTLHFSGASPEELQAHRRASETAGINGAWRRQVRPSR